jgi:hypothetical protein
MKRKSIRILIAVFFVQIAVMIVWYNVRKPRLLILHSYFSDYSWVKGVNAGLRGVIGSRNDYLVRWHYLDTKRHPWTHYREQAGNVARRLIRTWKPDVIIAVDDDAQEYAAKFFIGNPRIKIVFCGVNNGLERYGYHRADNATGILERLPLGAVREGLMTCMAQGKGGGPVRVFFLGDTSESMAGDEKWCRSFDWAPLRFAGSRLVDYYDEWKDAVRKIPEKADIILISDYRRVLRKRGGAEKDLVPAAEIIGWTETNSAVPVIGMNAFVAEDGGMLAIATSPNEQGEVAARMAVDILDNGIAPKSIPVQKTSRYVVSMRKSRIAARGFRVPKIYEEFARISNNFYK